MKKLLLALMLIPAVFSAQSPSEFKYQAVIRDANGSLLVNQQISIKVSILSGSAIGNTVYSETHTLGTNGYGVASITVGSGTVGSGVFENITWSTDDHFLKTELDISGGNNYQFMGTSEILSVPYANHAKTSATAIDDNDKSSSNEIQQLTLQGNQLVLSNGGGSVTLSGTIDLDADPTNELQALSLSNDTLYLSNGNYVVLPPDADGDSSNELQTLSINNNDISISNGNTISLPPIPVNNDNDSSNELQNLSINNNTISISNGNSVTLPPDGDSDATNEIQNLSLNNNNLSISGSNSVNLPANNDNSSTNELQNLTLNNNNLSISNGNSVNLPANNDNSSTNELQTLSYQNNTLSISNGNSISLGSSNFSLENPDGFKNMVPFTLAAGDTSGTTPVVPSATWPSVSSLYTAEYIVPQGKNLYINNYITTSFYDGHCGQNHINWSTTLSINSTVMFAGMSNFNASYGIVTPSLELPLILGAGDTLKLVPPHFCVSDYVGVSYASGFLVDQSVLPITLNKSLPVTSIYTVPNNKILVILNLHSQSGSTDLLSNYYNFRPYLRKGKYNYVYLSTSSTIDPHSFRSLYQPILIDENKPIYSSFHINGYLMDK